MSNKQQGDQVNINVFDQIDSICREFRQRWKDGKRPKIEHCFDQVPEDARSTLFRNLLQTEMRSRRQLNEHPKSDEYIKRFPEFKRLVRQAFDEPTMMSVDALQSTPGFADSSPTMTVEAPAANRIGDYELVRELGRGGFGIVFEAKHTKTGNRVALKTLHTATDGREINADRLYRFRREFRRLSEINHPNLVGMQTLEIDGGQWFFTMDLIEGEDFLSFVRPGDQFDEARLRSCLSQLATGVTELHRRGIIHRDLKPSNVLVTSDGRVTILDFGLAAELQKATDMTQTRSGMFAGTPRYAAPEQLFGERTEASDWYAFGTMLYEALTGDVPFHGKDGVELLRKKQEQEPPPLPNRVGVPNDLAELADGLVRRVPGERLAAEAVGQRLGVDQNTRSKGSTKESYGTEAAIDEEDDDGDLEGEGLALIGREKQLAQLESLRQEFTKQNQPAVLWITGRSGEGKSSLVEEFLRPLRRRDDLLVMSGRCYDRELVPFKVFDSSIDPLVRFLRSFSGTEIEAWIPEDIETLGHLFPLLRRVQVIDQRCRRAVVHRSDEHVRNLAFAAMKDLLVAIGEKCPVLWFVDDLQWGDSDSARMLLKLLSPPRPPRLMFIGSFRSDEMTDSPFSQTWQVGFADSAGPVRLHEVKVEPLTEQQCLVFLEAKGMKGVATLREQVAGLFRESHGNPYFLEQLLETYNEREQEFESVPFEQIIQQRLSQSPEGATEVLEWIAVLGKATSVSEVASLMGSSVDVMATITHMRSERLVRLMGTRSAIKVDTYHDKIRETVLRELTLEKRRRLHLKIAESLESNLNFDSTWQESGVSIPDQVFDAARHFLEAADARAFTYQLLAAQAALSAFALDTALEHFRTSNRVRPADAPHSQLFKLHFGFAAALHARGELSLARGEYDTALDLASTRAAWGHGTRLVGTRLVGTRLVGTQLVGTQLVGTQLAPPNAHRFFASLREGTVSPCAGLETGSLASSTTRCPRWISSTQSEPENSLSTLARNSAPSNFLIAYSKQS